MNAPEEFKSRLLTSETAEFKWLDIEILGRRGTTHTLAQFLRDQGVPDTFIDSALSGGSLPRIDSEGDTAFMLLRIFDEKAEKTASATQELTRKLSVIATPKALFTLHRFPSEQLPFHIGLLDRAKTISTASSALFSLALDIALETYLSATLRNEHDFDALEASAFDLPGSKSFKIKEVYFLKRRISTHGRMLEATVEALDRASSQPAFKAFAKSNHSRRIQRMASSSETFLEGLNHLLQLHLAMNSNRANEVMRVLTIFSAFFLPLSFIAGLYGMNFENMPELRHPKGYFFSLGLMGVVAAGIFIWFKRRKWIS